MANFDVELNDEVENFTVEFGEIQRITVDDFDKLRNRPSYAGQTMTHETNIPEVPTAVSQLTNDADYQTGSEVESAISTAVGDEKDAREQADAGLSRDIGVVDGKVDAEADARERADIALQGAIDDEETARKNADNGLQGQIDAITSSSDVVDIVGTYAELLQYPTAGLGDKDVIKVLQDETHNDAMSYYRWNKSSSTWSYIGSEGPYYTKSETNTLLGDKQDTLTAGLNITISSNNTISATDTTYTAGNGLTLTGTEFSADTTVLQPKLTAGDGINISAQNVISANIDPADFFTASETVDGTGSEMTLNNTIQAKIKSVQMDGDTFQQTYTGRNKVNFATINFTGANDGSGTRSGSTYTVTASSNSTYSGIQFTQGNNLNLKPNTTYTFSATVQSTENPDGSMVFVIGAYTVGGSNVAGNFAKAGERSVVTFTTPSSIPNNASIRLYPRAIDATAVFTDIMVEESATATSYEPYVGGIPSPNPDYPQAVQTVTGEQTVEVTGKNMFDKNASPSGYIGNVNSVEVLNTGVKVALSASSAYGAGAWIVGKVDDYLGQTLCLHATVSSSTGAAPRLMIGMCDQNLGSRAFRVGADGTGEKSISWAVSSADLGKYIYIGLYATNGSTSMPAGTYSDFNNLQLEQGSATAYEPYQSQSYTIDLGSTELCKIGDYQDYIYKSGDDWYVHKACEKVVFDGTEDWLRNDVNEVFTLSNVVPYLADGTAPYSDYFKGQANVLPYARMENNNVGLLQSDTSNRTIFKYTAITSASAFKTWLSSHNTTVYYPLATPTDTKITDATLISELDALADALGYKDKTIITVSATGTNLPAILEVSAYRNSLAGVLGVIGRAEAA